MAHLLVIDDEPSICSGFSKLGQALGHTVAVAASAEEGFLLAQNRRPELIVLDVRLPGMDGLAALERFHAELGNVPVIIITAHGELSTAVRAVRSGAFDYLVKPFDLEVAERVIQRALRPAGPSQATEASGPVGEEIVGISKPMQEVFKRTALVAASDACVHLRGESGTGKELVARAIHRYSRRASGPFVAVNIAALAPSVAESELFGHARGAFTGADQEHVGVLQRADGGTIFLDEVAEIPLSLQVKLLRALEHGEVAPVGGDRPVASDFRVITATHQDLGRQVANGSFRHDLYFRLITFEIEIPPLRSRREDIKPLAEHFVTVLAAKRGDRRPALSSEALSALQARSWYGNVRELRNAIEHAMVLARGNTLAVEHLPPPTPPPSSAIHSSQEEQIARLVRQWAEVELAEGESTTDLYERLLQLVEPPVLEEALRQCNGQCAAAARRLGMHRTTLRRKIDELGLQSSKELGD